MATKKRAASKTRKRASAARPKARKAPQRPAAFHPVRRKPETLRARTVLPAITVNDLARSITFYTGLGFVVGERWEEKGELRGVALKAGTCQLMLQQDDWAKGRDRVKGVGQRLWVMTAQDPDAIAAHAKASGVKLDEEPANLPWGPRAFAVTDPDGFKLTVAKES